MIYLKNSKITALFSALLMGAFMTSTVQAAEHVVKIVSDYDNMRMVFEPQNIKIQPGDTVVWVNEADESHNMMTYPDGYPKGGKAFKSPFLDKAGQTWSQTFEKEGVFEYHCIPHVMMGMRGKVIVGDDAIMKDSNIPTPEERAEYRNEMLEFFDEDDFEYMPDYVAELLIKNGSCDQACKAVE